MRQTCLVLCTLALAACQGSDREYYTSTSVTLNADGTQTVVQKQITAEQMVARQQRLIQGQRDFVNPNGIGIRQEAISQDSTCNVNSLWIFDAVSFGGDEICFSGVGTTNLGNYTSRCGGVPFHCYFWADSVRSYAAGTESGVLSENQYDAAGAQESFGAWASVVTAGSVGQDADWLTLDN